MNQDIMKRAMFAMPLSKQSRNAGIMQGFEDDMEMMEEPMGDEMMPMERTPQNPEILMNTLRGDMRSVDARYAELAGMVGEEAAMETPPEVLAILQDHFAMMEQPQGIGALPQGGEMMPPMMPAQGQAPMPMDQGPMGGMEGMPPFPPGGSEGAPPTPDGLPPAQMAIGGLAAVGQRIAGMGPALSRFGSAFNQSLGRIAFPAGGTGPGSTPITMPYLQNLRGAGGRFTAQQVVQGGTPIYPTFTQGVGSALAQSRLGKAMPFLGLAGLAMYGQSGDQGEKASQEGDVYLTPEGVPMPYMSEADRAGQAMFPPLVEMPKPAAEEPPAQPVTATPEVMPSVTGGVDIYEGLTTDKFIDMAKQRQAAEEVKAPETKADRMARIRKGSEEYKALFKDIVGEDDDLNKANAWFLLADAGAKIATSTQPTIATALAEGLSGVPQGLSKMVSDARDRDVKFSMAALNASIGDIQAQEKFARDLTLKQIEARGKMALELLKAQGKGLRYEVGTAGIVRNKNQSGDVVGYTVDANSPVLKSIIESPNTLTQATPFVKDLGPGTGAILEDDKLRNEKVVAINAADQGIRVIDDMIGSYQKAFGPQASMVNFANNWIIPVIPTVEPVWEDRQTAVDQFTQRQETLRTLLARMEREGRTAVQQEKWAMEALGLTSGAFLQDPTVALAKLLSARAGLVNKRQDAMGQLVELPTNLVAGIPPTGTASSPFDLTGENRQSVLTYLQSFAKVAPEGMEVNVRMPNGTLTKVPVRQFLEMK